MFFLHMVAAYALIVLLGMHVGAALMHYVIRKDGVLRACWCGRAVGVRLAGFP